MQRFTILVLVVFSLLFLVSPAQGAISLDVGVASPNYALRWLDGSGETDFIYQNYGLAFHGYYVSEGSGLQLEIAYVYAPWEVAGDDLQINSGEVKLKLARKKSIDPTGSGFTYWLLSYRQDEIELAETPVYESRQAMIGTEVFVLVSGSLSFGAGGGWRQTTTNAQTVSGPALAVWFNLAIQLNDHTEVWFTSNMSWAHLSGTDITVMERDTIASLGLGFTF